MRYALSGMNDAGISLLRLTVSTAAVSLNERGRWKTVRGLSPAEETVGAFLPRPLIVCAVGGVSAVDDGPPVGV